MRFAHLKRILRLGRLRGFVVHEAPRMSLFWLPSLRISGASRRWLRDHHQLMLCVLRSVGVALRALGSADQRRSALANAERHPFLYSRLLQQNRPNPDLA